MGARCVTVGVLKKGSRTGAKSSEASEVYWLWKRACASIANGGRTRPQILQRS